MKSSAHTRVKAPLRSKRASFSSMIAGIVRQRFLEVDSRVILLYQNVRLQTLHVWHKDAALASGRASDFGTAPVLVPYYRGPANGSTLRNYLDLLL